MLNFRNRVLLLLLLLLSVVWRRQELIHYFSEELILCVYGDRLSCDQIIFFSELENSIIISSFFFHFNVAQNGMWCEKSGLKSCFTFGLELNKKKQFQDSLTLCAIPPQLTASSLLFSIQNIFVCLLIEPKN